MFFTHNKVQFTSSLLCTEYSFFFTLDRAGSGIEYSNPSPTPIAHDTIIRYLFLKQLSVPAQISRFNGQWKIVECAAYQV